MNGSNRFTVVPSRPATSKSLLFEIRFSHLPITKTPLFPFLGPDSAAVMGIPLCFCSSSRFSRWNGIQLLMTVTVASTSFESNNDPGL